MPVKAERTAMLETESWVAIAFLCFLGLLAYLGAHRKVIDAIDRRQARIKSELEQARRLREEAQALLGEFQRKAHEAENEAQAIMAGAQAEAARLTAEAKSRAEDFVAPRWPKPRSPRPKLKRWPTCVLPQPKPPWPPQRRSSPQAPREKSRKICWRAALPSSNRNSTDL
jgi:hypothetical protein